MIYRAIIFLFFLCVFTGTTSSAELKIFTEEFPPYNYSDSGQPRGINVDIVTEICELAEVRCVFEILPWQRAYDSALQEKNSGVMSTSRNSSREKLFHWVGPLASSRTNFYRLKTRHDIKIRKQEDLLKYTIGIPRSDIYHTLLTDIGFQHGVNLMSFSHKHDDMNVFFTGKLDLIIGSELTLPYQLLAVGRQVSDVIPVFTLKHQELRGNYLALNLETEPAIKSRLEMAINTITNRNGFKRHIERYRVPHQ